MYTQDNYGEDDEDTRPNVYFKNSNHSQFSKHYVIGMGKDRQISGTEERQRLIKYVTAVAFHFNDKKVVLAKLLSIKKKRKSDPSLTSYRKKKSPRLKKESKYFRIQG